MNGKQCIFMDFRLQCKVETVENSDFCKRHFNRRCVVCKKKQAVKYCGSLTCESPICSECKCDHKH